MFGPELRQWLLGLSAPGLVAFLRGLLLAEASRTGAPLTSVTMTGDIYTRDGGVDGQTDLPGTANPAFPVGPRSWQIKATTAINLRDELMKPGVLEDLANGRDYIIVSSREFAGRGREDLELHLRTAIEEIAPGRTGMVLGLEALERLATAQPTVVARHSGPTVLGMTLEQWARELDVARYPYTPDAARTAAVARIRAFVSESTLPNHLHVFGDTGVGKSRAVFEALADEGLIERVAANFGFHAGLDLNVAQAAAGGSAAIVVVDDCTPAERETLRRYAGASEGSFRLVTLGDRLVRSTMADATSVDLMPLEDGTITRLLEQVSHLSPEDARLITDLAQGYPKLAALLADALAAAAARGSITALLRGDRLAALLDEMIPDEAVRDDLTILSLVGRLGFEGELEFEAHQLCDAFGVPFLRFQQNVEREIHRFVSASGRYRRVTPKALAVWLVQRLMERDPDFFVERSARLPENIYEEFRAQLEMFGGDPMFDRILGGVVVRRAGTFRTVTDLTAADARMLNAVAFAAPEVAEQHIVTVVVSSSFDELLAFGGEARRSLVWALEHLLWFQTTYEGAASALLALAAAENEDWGNNATGVLKDSFQLLLGGTEVPIDRRLAWLRSEIDRFGDASGSVAVTIVTGALQSHESRGANWRGARLQPEEWRPRDNDEAREARRGALAILLDLARQNPHTRPLVAQKIAETLGVIAQNGLVEDLAAGLEIDAWSASERATVSSAIRRELQYRVGLPDADVERLGSLREALEGGGFESRLATALSTEYWGLEGSIAATADGSPRLDGLALEASVLTAPELAMAVLGLPSPRGSTLFAFGRAIAVIDATGRLLSLAEDVALSSDFRVGLASGYAVNSPAWAEALAETYAEHPALAADLPFLASTMPSSDHLVDLTVAAIHAGHAPRQELYRLRLGLWVRGVSALSLVALLRTVLDGAPSPMDIEIGLGLIDAWLEDPATQLPTELEPVVNDLLQRAAQMAGDDRGGMLSFSRNRVAQRIRQEPLNRLENSLAALQQGTYPSDDDVATIEAAGRERPVEAVGRVIDFLATPDWRRFTVEWAHVLSAIGRGAGPNIVLEHVAQRTTDEQDQLLAHLDFTADEPDPVFVGMLDANWPREGFKSAAMSRFVYPGEVTMGPISHSLQAKLDRARRWAADATSTALEQWATELAKLLEPRIAEQMAKESEEE